MRRDMFEVIIERPRWGHAGIVQKGRHDERSDRALERAPKRLGMGRRVGWSKDLNENLAPLRRFLRARVGKPWDKVRSEMCAVLSMSSAVQKHVMDHVKDYVEENPVFIDGVPHSPIARSGEYWPLSRSHGRWWQFYVCPKTRLLREVRSARRERATSSGG